MKVLKFGGTSVGSEKGLSQVKKIVESCSEDVIVVVSALGGITDQLLLTARLAAAGDEAYMPQCTAMIARHNELVEKIVLPENRPGVQNRLDELLDDLEESGVKNPLLLVLDGVTDPHNLGACLRVADGAGVHAVIAPKDHASGINATVAKVASGAAETA